MDKNKVIQVATKYVQKGQLDRAVAEYSKILKEDPRDVRILLKVGELQQKKGDVATAARTLLQVAETYSTDGFFLKAVAVYKQVLKLEPGQVEIHLKLAELYQQLGLMQDALAQYGLVAAHHEKGGNLGAAIDAIRRLVDLEPDNLAGRINLAELFAKEGRNGEAVQEFRRAAEALKAQNRVEEYLRVGERIVFLDGNDLALTRELANLYLARGDTKRALAKLQACFGVDPRHVETLELLGRTFLDLGQLTKAASVYKELARVHAEAGDADEARAVWKKIQRFAPDDADVRATLEAPVIPAAPAAPAGAPAAPRGAVLGRIALQPAGGVRTPAPAAAAWNGGRVAAPVPSVPAPPPDETPRQAVERLIAETDVYVKYGLRDKAFDHLRRVLELDPDCIEAHERASTLFAAGGNQPAAWAELVTVCRICAQRGMLERGRAYYERLRDEAPHLPEVEALADAYVLSQSQGPALEESFEAVDEVVPEEAAEVSDEIRLEPTGGAPTVAERPAPEARPLDTVDDEALAAAMVSAGTEQIDENAAVVLPGEDPFEFEPEPAPGEDRDWFGDPGDRVASPGSRDDGAVDRADGVALVAGVIPDADGDDALLASGAGPGPVGLDELNTLPAGPDLDGGELLAPAPPGRGPDVGNEPELEEAAAIVGLPDDDEALFSSPDDDILEVGEDAIVEIPDEETPVEPAGPGAALAPGEVLSLDLPGPSGRSGPGQERLDVAGPAEAIEPGPVLSLDSTGPAEAIEPDSIRALDLAGPPEAIGPAAILSLDSTGPAEAIEPDEILTLDSTGPEEAIEPDAVRSLDEAGSPDTIEPDELLSLDSAGPADAIELEASTPGPADGIEPDAILAFDPPGAAPEPVPSHDVWSLRTVGPDHAIAAYGEAPTEPESTFEPLRAPSFEAPDTDVPGVVPPGPSAPADLLIEPPPEPPPPASSLEALRLDPEELADLETELAEAEFFLAQGLLNEAEDICRSILFRAPGHPTAAAILGDVAACRAAAAEGDELGSDLALDVEFDTDSAGNELDYQYAVEDVLQAFKAGVSRTVTPEDSQTHYDLGIAYKEMGLLADAIEQFSTAASGFRGAPREADCLSLIAICRREAGEHDEAVARLEEALDLPAVDALTRQALLFELGATHEARGDDAAALAAYADVERQDPGFRGVGRIVARLRHRAAATRNNPAG